MTMLQGHDSLEGKFGLLKKKDPAVFSFFFYMHYANLLEKVIPKCDKDEDAAKDIVQESFIVLWYKADKIKNVDGIWPFLLVTARYKIKEYWRQQGKKVSLASDDDFWTGEDWQADSVNDVYNRRRSLILLKLEQLPGQMREVCQRKIGLYMSNEEIAAELGISVHTVKNHLAAAMKKLEKILPRDNYLFLLLLLFHWQTRQSPSLAAAEKNKKNSPYTLVKKQGISDYRAYGG